MRPPDQWIDCKPDQRAKARPVAVTSVRGRRFDFDGSCRIVGSFGSGIGSVVSGLCGCVSSVAGRVSGGVSRVSGRIGRRVGCIIGRIGRIIRSIGGCIGAAIGFDGDSGVAGIGRRDLVIPTHEEEDDQNGDENTAHDEPKRVVSLLISHVNPFSAQIILCPDNSDPAGLVP